MFPEILLYSSCVPSSAAIPHPESLQHRGGKADVIPCLIHFQGMAEIFMEYQRLSFYAWRDLCKWTTVSTKFTGLILLRDQNSAPL